MDEQLKEIAEHYGYDDQSLQLIEEMAELIQKTSATDRKSFVMSSQKWRSRDGRCIYY